VSPSLPFPELAAQHRRLIGGWLAIWAVMLLLTIVIGGVTRLTESGLSITEWRPVSGIVPPLSRAAWEEAFAKYRQVPEYQQLNQGMTLAEFQRIFLWEYIHRLWARLVGLAFAVPLAVLVMRRWLSRALTRRLVLLLVLTGLQGAMGWFMVRSGLSERTDVSQYRLAAHLGLALVIYVITVWTAAGLLADGRTGGRADGRIDGSTDRRIGQAAMVLAALVFLTAVAGAFVAGLDAGRAYNTFPLMGGRVIPGGYAALTPWWRNLFEHVPAVQFNHRLLGILSLIGALAVWVAGLRAGLAGRARLWLQLLPTVGAFQVTLGIATLLLAVPVAVAALHQAGAVLLLTVSVLLVHGTRR
jgi:cytochrome c oxidase assembly protein subunit 15